MLCSIYLTYITVYMYIELFFCYLCFAGLWTISMQFQPLQKSLFLHMWSAEHTRTVLIEQPQITLKSMKCCSNQKASANPWTSSYSKYNKSKPCQSIALWAHPLLSWDNGQNICHCHYWLNTLPLITKREGGAINTYLFSDFWFVGFLDDTQMWGHFHSMMGRRLYRANSGRKQWSLLNVSFCT